jgi:signal transduction histidine kinase
MVEKIVQNQAPTAHALLVVDDSATSLIAYRAALESLGRAVVTAGSGNEAVRLLGLHQFALLLIDVHMPGMDGFETVRLLRGQLHKMTPVVFVTGDGDDEAMRRAYEFGAVDYLVKPVSPEVLRGKVRNLIAFYDQGIELERRATLLQEQHAKLVEADALLRTQDTNIGILAHDLRNPLDAVVTGVNVLARLPGLPETGQRTIERVTRSAQRMSAMIRDILDFTRGRLGGGIPVNREPTDLAVVSRSIVEEIQTGHPTANVEVETAGKLIGHFDAARIEQALSNLLVNAVQHGSGHAKLIASGEDRDHVVVTVRNDGVPIPQDQLQTIFEPFQKGDRSPTGLGLGLFIVREIIRAHDGTLEVTSSAEGTSFSFRVPRWGRPL